MAITTLTEMFLAGLEHDKPDCFLYKENGTYHPLSTADFYANVRRVAAALLEFGVSRGDRVALMAENCTAWPTIDYATLSVGAVLVPIYPTLTPDQAAYVANDCGAEVVFVQGRERYEGMIEEREDTPEVRQYVVIDEAIEGPDTLPFANLLSETEPMSEEAFRSSALLSKPEDLATFIYTSGTTGNPKGVMLTHGNLTSNLIAASKAIEIRRDQTGLSFLPLSHSFERIVDFIYFYKGTTIAYAESVQAVGQNLMEVRPHFFVSVPRVYEKVLNKVRENVAVAPPLRQKIFAWAEAVGREALPYRLARRACSDSNSRSPTNSSSARSASVSAADSRPPPRAARPWVQTSLASSGARGSRSTRVTVCRRPRRCSPSTHRDRSSSVPSARRSTV